MFGNYRDIKLFHNYKLVQKISNIVKLGGMEYLITGNETKLVTVKLGSYSKFTCFKKVDYSHGSSSLFLRYN